jgi:hypothetical protein
VQEGSFGKKIPTLIHPPSKCGRCVQHILLDIRYIYVLLFIIYPLSFHDKNNMDQWYQSRLLLIIFFQCMSPTRSKYSKLGHELVSLKESLSHMPKKSSMEEENKNGRENDFINLLLEQALTQKRDEMMENFSHIIQHLSITTGASSSSEHFGGTSPFKVQFNFYIPIFEGH